MRCVMKILIKQHFTPVELKRRFDHDRSLSMHTVMRRGVFRAGFTFEIDKNSRIVCEFFFDDCYRVVLSPKSIGIDPIVEFDEAAASWLGFKTD